MGLYGMFYPKSFNWKSKYSNTSGDLTLLYPTRLFRSTPWTAALCTFPPPSLAVTWRGVESGDEVGSCNVYSDTGWNDQRIPTGWTLYENFPMHSIFFWVFYLHYVSNIHLTPIVQFFWNVDLRNLVASSRSKQLIS